MIVCYRKSRELLDRFCWNFLVRFLISAGRLWVSFFLFFFIKISFVVFCYNKKQLSNITRAIALQVNAIWFGRSDGTGGWWTGEGLRTFFFVTGNAVRVSELVINKQETKKKSDGSFWLRFSRVEKKNSNSN